MSEVVVGDEIPTWCIFTDKYKCGDLLLHLINKDIVCAYALLDLQRDNPNIYLVALQTNPDELRKGYADVLLKHIIESYPDKTILLEVPLYIGKDPVLNYPALDLYSKHEFVWMSNAGSCIALIRYTCDEFPYDFDDEIEDGVDSHTSS